MLCVTAVIEPAAPRPLINWSSIHEDEKQYLAVKWKGNIKHTTINLFSSSSKESQRIHLGPMMYYYRLVTLCQENKVYQPYASKRM